MVNGCMMEYVTIMLAVDSLYLLWSRPHPFLKFFDLVARQQVTNVITNYFVFYFKGLIEIIMGTWKNVC